MKTMKVFGEDSRSNENTRPAFGIDLGTTNSAISVLKTGKVPTIIKLSDGKTTLPSCVMWTGKGREFIVGREAYNNRFKPNVIYSVKRMMGSDNVIELEYAKKKLKLSPEEVSAEILKELVRQASVEYGEVKDVVITVPAYFNNKQLEATRKAGELAGLNVLKTFREPTSASVLYDLDDTKVKEECVLVYDLGGGTFDVSLVRISTNTDCSDLDEIYGFVKAKTKETSGNKILSVMKTDGDTKLGGDDIDNEIYKILEKKIVDLGYDPKYIPTVEKEKLKLRIEQKKKEGQFMHEMHLDFKLNDTKGTHLNEKIYLTPEDFATATKVIYDKTKKCMDIVLNGINIHTIDSIVLVGGSTKSEFIKSFLRRDFPNVKINDALNPDESVALGAAVEAKRSKYGNSTINVFDVLPLSIGVFADNIVSKVILKNQVVPFSSTRTFSTVFDNQEEINIEVYQGNSTVKEECTYLGNLIVKDIPKGKAKSVRIQITLAVNAEGILKCSATVGNITKEIVLTNLFDGNSKLNKNTPVDKKYIRWKKFADDLKNNSDKVIQANELYRLLTKYEQGDKSVQRDIVKLIADNKEASQRVISTTGISELADS